MLRSYKEHRASTMIADHQQSAVTLSGVRATDEVRFQKKKRDKSQKTSTNILPALSI